MILGLLNQYNTLLNQNAQVILNRNSLLTQQDVLIFKQIYFIINNTSGERLNTCNPRIHLYHNNTQIREIAIHNLTNVSNGSIVPRCATDYQMGVCVQYNKHKMNLPLLDAISLARIPNSRKEKAIKLNQYFQTTISKSELFELGQTSYSYMYMSDNQTTSENWKSDVSTPKTDILSSDGRKYSVKKEHSSSKLLQLSSGYKCQTISLLQSTKLYIQALYKNYDRCILTMIDQLILDIDESYSSFSISDISSYKSDITNKYYYIRIPQDTVNTYSTKQLSQNDIYILKKRQLTVNNTKLTQHDNIANVQNILRYQCNREISTYNYWLDQSKYNTTFSGFRLQQLQQTQFLTIVGDIMSTYTPEISFELQRLFKHSLQFPKVKGKFLQLLEFKQFKQGLVFEASTGLYKFDGYISNDPYGQLDNASQAVPNYFLVLFPSGSIKSIKKITRQVISDIADSLKIQIAFKGTGNKTSTATRILAETT